MTTTDRPAVAPTPPPGPARSGAMEPIVLAVLDRGVRVDCSDAHVRALLGATYGHMQSHHPAAVALRYGVGKAGAATFIARDGRDRLTARDSGEFLALFDDDLVIELQKLRPDLFFIHAAVLVHAEHALLLVAPSGGGKSTTSWALLHHGFTYLSDELAPVDLATRHVHPYPRALCLKREPSAPYPLPDTAVYTSRSIHIPTVGLPRPFRREAAPLAAIFFLQYEADASGPWVRRISAAQAGARLYANTLNALAHPGEGLDGAMEIVTRAACFELGTADLTGACALVAATLDERRLD